MEEYTYSILKEEDTEKFGQILAGLLTSGDVVGLCGDLGAGKTALCRFIARALGVPSKIPVNSPTFTLINEYPGTAFNIYHMDFYRLFSGDELHDLGIWEYYESKGICLVEWYDKFEDFWPEEALLIKIELGKGERRLLTLQGCKRSAQIISDLKVKINSCR